MSEGSRAVECYSFLVAFANDDIIDAKELAFIEKLVLRDGKVDDDEKHVLRNIFSRVNLDKVAPEVRQEMQHFSEKYEVGWQPAR